MEHNLIQQGSEPNVRLNPKLFTVSYEEMEAHLTDPLTRIIDSRMLELGDNFEYAFQVLQNDNSIVQTICRVGDKESKIVPLDLFKLQYRNNPRNNPGLYGLLDTGVQDNG